MLRIFPFRGAHWPTARVRICRYQRGRHPARNVAIDYNVALSYIVEVRQITYTRAAIKTLRKMPANTARLIMAKVEQYAADPASLANNVTELKGRTGRRLRVNS